MSDTDFEVGQRVIALETIGGGMMSDPRVRNGDVGVVSKVSGWLNSSYQVTFENGAKEAISHSQIQAL